MLDNYEKYKSDWEINILHQIDAREDKMYDDKQIKVSDNKTLIEQLDQQLNKNEVAKVFEQAFAGQQNPA